MGDGATITVVPFGHGGGIPLDGSGQTNFALVAGDAPADVPLEDVLRDRPYWLVDCGAETLTRLTTTGRFPDAMIRNLVGVLLTHAHTDHSGGLPALAWRTRFIEKHRVQLVVPAPVVPMLDGQLVELTYGADGRVPWQGHFEVTELEPGAPARITGPDTGPPPFTVEAFAVDHGIPSFPAFALAVDAGPGAHALFSGDTAYPLPAERVAAADAVFHDCQFHDDGSSGTHAHCPYPMLEAAVPAEHRGKVHLVHTQMRPPKRALDAGFPWGHRDARVPLGANAA